MDRLYKVRVRRWYPPAGHYVRGDAVWDDREVLVEADNLDSAKEQGYEHLMSTAFFGANPQHCQVVMVAGAELPYVL